MGLVIGFFLGWSFLPAFARSRALVIMNVYDVIQTETAGLKEYPLSVKLPYAKPLMLDSGTYEFLPVMNTFNASKGFSNWHGQELELVIDYAVPDFERGQSGFRKSYSAFYEPTHPLYSSYFGCYYLKGHSTPLDRETVLAVMEYDIRLLALPAVGLHYEDSSFQVNEIKPVKSIVLDSLEWTVYDALIKLNGPWHVPEHFQWGYLQFGRPPLGLGEGDEYPPVTMHGRIYVTSLPDRDLSLGLYVLAPTQEALLAIAETYLENVNLVWQVD